MRTVEGETERVQPGGDATLHGAHGTRPALGPTPTSDADGGSDDAPAPWSRPRHPRARGEPERARGRPGVPGTRRRSPSLPTPRPHRTPGRKRRGRCPGKRLACANWRSWGRSSGSLPQALCAVVVSRLVFISAALPVSRDNSPLGRESSGANSIAHEYHSCKEPLPSSWTLPGGGAGQGRCPGGRHAPPAERCVKVARGGGALTHPDPSPIPGASRRSTPSDGGIPGAPPPTRRARRRTGSPGRE
jgi:hypothetical protein